MSSTEDDAAQLERIRRLNAVTASIRESPAQYEGAGRLIDEQFSRAAFRLERARMIRKQRAIYVPLIAAAKAAEAQGDASRSAEAARWKHMLDALTDPLDFHYGRWRIPRAREWERHCLSFGLNPADYRPADLPADRLTRPKSQPIARALQAIAWCRELNLATASEDELRAVLVLGWLVHDRETQAVSPVICEFQRLPWPWDSVVEAEPCQGRAMLNVGLQDRGDRFWTQLEHAWEVLAPNHADSGRRSSRQDHVSFQVDLGDAPPLTPPEIAMLRVFLDSPLPVCVKADAVCEAAFNRHRDHGRMDAADFRTRIVPRLKKWGLKSEGRRGYSLPPDALARRAINPGG